MRTVLSAPLQVSILCWFALELGLLVRDLARRKGRSRRDHGTRAIVSLSLAGSIWLAMLVPGWLPMLDTPARHGFAVAGVIAIWIGLAVRVWAVATLGGSFSTFIEVDTGQPIVSRGPYRWVRHPSYTGLLLIACGFGLAAGNALAFVICAVIPLLGLSRRIAVEESEMIRVLGARYRCYQRSTHRLVPGVW